MNKRPIRHDFWIGTIWNRSRVNIASYEHIENFTKVSEVRRNLGNRASPVKRAHMKITIARVWCVVLAHVMWSNALVIVQNK